MPVYVVIKRKFKINRPDQLMPLLKELRLAAMEQPGYLSAVTLRSTEDQEDYLVVSQWETAEHWQNWFASKERRDLQGKVDSLIGERTFYELFDPVD